VAEPQFGGPWTEEKLMRLRKYLQAYMSIFSKNPRAKLLNTMYVDAFAGTGFRKEMSSPESGDLFDDVTADWDADALRKGSTQVALETTPPFAEYIFIEHNEVHAANLSRLRQQFPRIAQRIRIVAEDANVYLTQWCKTTDWRSTRAVVFLDPYGMQVEWATIEAIAETKSVDPGYCSRWGWE
jgi:three-Cys-motif partner protein